MQMYVNYYTRQLMNEGDNPPIGIAIVGLNGKRNPDMMRLMACLKLHIALGFEEANRIICFRKGL